MKNGSKNHQHRDNISAINTDSLQKTFTTGLNLRGKLRRIIWRVIWRNKEQPQHGAFNLLSDAQLRDIGLTRENFDKEHSHSGWPNWPR